MNFLSADRKIVNKMTLAAQRRTEILHIEVYRTSDDPAHHKKNRPLSEMA